LHDSSYIPIMEYSITPEIAMAIRKGENNYAQLLFDMGIEQAPKIAAVHVDNLSANQKLGCDHVERRLRGTV